MTASQKARESTPTTASAHDKILIVDFGSQVTQLIARRVREEGVYSEIVPFQKAEAAFKEMKPKAVILSGGPESVHEKGSPRAPQKIFDSGVPVLGICYGQMTMAAQLGGEVGRRMALALHGSSIRLLMSPREPHGQIRSIILT